MRKKHFYVNVSEKNVSEPRPNMSENLRNYMIFSARKRIIRCLFFNLNDAYLIDYDGKNKLQV